MSSRSTLAAAFLLAAVCSNSAVMAAPRDFKIDDQDHRDVVSFNSDAPIELIVGNTHQIVGNIQIDDSTDLTKPVKCSFDVDLTTIDTGIPLRNEHMRSEKFLDTKKYPKASFVLKSLKNPPKKLIPGQKVTLNAVGDFSLHGKTVSKTIPVDVTYFTRCKATDTKREGCDLIQFKSTFPVPFKDHNIQRPEAVFQKLADTVFVTVSATAYNQVAGAGGKEAKEAKPATGNKAKQ